MFFFGFFVLLSMRREIWCLSSVSLFSFGFLLGTIKGQDLNISSTVFKRKATDMMHFTNQTVGANWYVGGISKPKVGK